MFFTEGILDYKVLYKVLTYSIIDFYFVYFASIFLTADLDELQVILMSLKS